METGGTDLPMKKVLGNVRVLVALMTCSIGAYTVGTLEATLSPFLLEMEISVKMIAVAFLAMSLCSGKIINKCCIYLRQKVNI